MSEQTLPTFIYVKERYESWPFQDTTTKYRFNIARLILIFQKTDVKKNTVVFL